jgi:hypothetical protein
LDLLTALSIIGLLGAAAFIMVYISCLFIALFDAQRLHLLTQDEENRAAEYWATKQRMEE